MHGLTIAGIPVLGHVGAREYRYSGRTPVFESVFDKGNWRRWYNSVADIDTDRRKEATNITEAK